MPSETAPRVRDLDVLLREGAVRAQRLGHPVLVSLTRRLAPRDPLEVFAEAAGGQRALWLRPVTGESLVGLGAARTLLARRPDRYQQVAQAWHDLLTDAVVEDPDRRAWTGPLLLGGFSFDPSRVPLPHWAGFPPARLVLPARLLAQRDGEAWETTNVLVSPHPPSPEWPHGGALQPAERCALVDPWPDAPGSAWTPPGAGGAPEAFSLDSPECAWTAQGASSAPKALPLNSPDCAWTAQGASGDPEDAPPDWSGRSWTRLAATGDAVPKKIPAASGAMRRAETWQALVESVARGIRDGSLGLEKVVLAREAHVVAETQVEPDACLRRLAGEYPTCTVFAVAQNNACFLGATPERLAQADQGTVSTMALAGSIARGATPEDDQRLGEQLLASAKERAEHAVVVRAVREALSSPDLCTSLIADTGPRLARLPNVQHLLTPIHAQLAPGKTLLDLLARLHPSPAVGGFPTPRALAIIREREGVDRGWYGGPFGWLNAAGDGEFVVSIRSGLLRGREAWLYAGCGIVADSDPAAEYAESELKLRPMRSALGFSPA